MEKALKLLTDAGYDAYIEHGHLYYRTPEGGIVAVYEGMLPSLLARGTE